MNILKCPVSFLRFMRACCILSVFLTINFGAVGCDETKKYNPYDVTDNSASPASIESSQVGNGAVVDTPEYERPDVFAKRVKDSLANEFKYRAGQAQSEHKKTDEEIEKPETIDTVPPALEKPIVAKMPIKSPGAVRRTKPTSIASSEKSKATSKPELYNKPCLLKVQIKKGMTPYALCKKHGLTYTKLVEINKPGIVENFRIGNWVCLKRKA
jgi:hypothetical protein